jgi:hypothetical protein
MVVVVVVVLWVEGGGMYSWRLREATQSKICVAQRISDITQKKDGG